MAKSRKHRSTTKKSSERDRAQSATKRPSVVRNGVAVSPGVAIGKAYCIRDIFVGTEPRPLADADVLGELDRYEAARTKAADKDRHLRSGEGQELGPVDQQLLAGCRHASRPDPNDKANAADNDGLPAGADGRIRPPLSCRAFP